MTEKGKITFDFGQAFAGKIYREGWKVNNKMRLLKWFLIKAIFAIAIYMGFIGEYEGAYNVAMFIAWFSIITTLALFSDAVIDAMKKKGRSAPSWFDLTFDTIVTLAFVLFGALATGVFYIIHALIKEAAWEKAAERT